MLYSDIFLYCTLCLFINQPRNKKKKKNLYCNVPQNFMYQMNPIFSSFTAHKHSSPVFGPNRHRPSETMCRKLTYAPYERDLSFNFLAPLGFFLLFFHQLTRFLIFSFFWLKNWMLPMGFEPVSQNRLDGDCGGQTLASF